ncbi:MAG: DUF3343 domain-containing protein [Clostridia bacterium]|nr:DUF3343 domain-containing protein [Clostridia bacterium]
MEGIIILLSSSTSAVRLKDALAKKGFNAKVIQTPSRLAKEGCNYSVKTVSFALAEAEKIIKLLGMKSRGIYLDTGIEKMRYRPISSGDEI